LRPPRKDRHFRVLDFPSWPFYFIMKNKEDKSIMEVKFYRCPHCGNIVGMVHDSGVNPVCCGEKMKELVPNTVEASKEKHVPVVEVVGHLVKVNVGSIDHPMLPEHFIQWVYIKTTHGGQRHELVPGGKPHAEFALVEGEKVLEVFEYCNLHGLWKTVL
jgi:superoxide reductase